MGLCPSDPEGLRPPSPTRVSRALCSPCFSGGSPKGLSAPPGRARGKLRVSSGAAQRVYQHMLFPPGKPRDLKRARRCSFYSSWRSPLEWRSQPLLFQPRASEEPGPGANFSSSEPPTPKCPHLPFSTRGKARDGACMGAHCRWRGGTQLAIHAGRCWGESMGRAAPSRLPPARPSPGPEASKRESWSSVSLFARQRAFC